MSILTTISPPLFLDGGECWDASSWASPTGYSPLGPKDKTALKIATVGQAMMLPLMAMAGFGTDAATYAQNHVEDATHRPTLAMTYVGYSASQPTKTRSSSRRR